MCTFLYMGLLFSMYGAVKVFWLATGRADLYIP